MPALEPPAGSDTPGTPGSLVPSGGTAMPGDPGHLTPSTPTPPPSPPPANQPVTPSPAPIAPPTNLPQTPISPPAGFVPSSKADTDAGNVGPHANAWRTAIGAEARINTATAKTTLVDADELPLVDSAASGATKKVTWANFKAMLGGLFVGLTGNQTKSGVLTFASAPKGTGIPTYTDSTEYLTQGQIEEFLTRPQTFIEADNFLTAKRWYEQMTGTGSVDAGYNAAAGLGGFALNTGATSGSIAGLAIGVNGNFSPLSYKPWKLRFRIRTGGNISNCKIRVGLSGNGNNFNQDLWAVGGMGFDYNPSLNANWRFANDPGGGSPSYTSMTVAVAANTIYDFLIRSSGTDNQCYVSINGGAETLITGARDYLVGPALAIQNTSAASRSLIPLAFGFFAHRP